MIDITMMYRSFIVLALSLVVGSANGQKPLVFEYDAAGNRVLRTVKRSEAGESENSAFWKNFEITSPSTNVFRFKPRWISANDISNVEVYNSAGYVVRYINSSSDGFVVDLSTIGVRGVYVIKCLYQRCTYSYSVTVK